MSDFWKVLKEVLITTIICLLLGYLGGQVISCNKIRNQAYMDCLKTNRTAIECKEGLVK